MYEVLKNLIAERGEGGKLMAQLIVSGAMVQGVVEEMSKNVFRAIAMMPKDPRNPKPQLADLMFTETWFAGDAVQAVVIPASGELAESYQKLLGVKVGEESRIYRV